MDCFFTMHFLDFLSWLFYVIKLGNGSDIFPSAGVLPSIFWIAIIRHIDKAIEFEGWSNPMFCFKFFVSCIMGLVLNFAVVLCTQEIVNLIQDSAFKEKWVNKKQLNTSLTTTVVGCLKNISIAYYGMLYFPDYVFSMLNFVGINISILGSLLYSYVAFKTDKKSLPTHVRLTKAWDFLCEIINSKI